jgi:hypothetical protein
MLSPSRDEQALDHSQIKGRRQLYSADSSVTGVAEIIATVVVMAACHGQESYTHREKKINRAC